MIPRPIVLSYLAVGALSVAPLLSPGTAAARTSSAGSLPAACEIPRVVPALAEPAVNLVGFLVAVLLFAWAFSRSRGTVRWKDAPQPSVPGWTPRSWSSNLAVGGAVLSSLLAAAALPADTCVLPRASYTVLSLTFSAFVALAPASYGLLKADGAPSPRAAFRLFAFAAGITAWGTLGQLGTAACIFLELMVCRAIGWPSAFAGILVLSGVAVAVTTYTFRCVASYFEPSPPDGTPRQPRPVKADVREWALL